MTLPATFSHKNYQAFLFDLNGTMVDDMPYHIQAWHRILVRLGAPISLQKTREECYGKNSEMIERTFPGVYSDEEKDELEYEKEKAYREDFKPYLKLIEGLQEFLAEAKATGIRTAIGSAAIRLNIDFVLDGLGLHAFFDAIVSANDVQVSKPHPETFLKFANALGVKPANCLVFEDTPKGVETALNAGMGCLVITTLHQPEEFSAYPNIVGFLKDYREDVLKELLPQKETVQ